MKIYHQEPVEANVIPEVGDYLTARYHLTDGAPTRITVGRGAKWTPLACKEVYGKAVKMAVELGYKSCVFDLTAAAELGFAGLCAAAEGICGGSYQKKFCLTDQIEADMDFYADGSGWDAADLENAWELARSIMMVRNLVNCPSNLLHPETFAQKLTAMGKDLPVETRVYTRQELADKGMDALLYVGDSSGNPPALAVLRYTGAPESNQRLGLVGKGVTVDSGGYSLKHGNLDGIKGDMAGGAAVAATVHALASVGAKVNVTAVIPACENRISRESGLPGDVISSFSGKTIEVLNTDAEGRLILADALTWAIEEEGCTKLLDIATLTGAMWAMLGFVTTGVMANDDEFYHHLEAASEISGERFWRMPAFPEYEKLIESDLADVRNTSKDGCGSITAGLFLKKFTQDLPWLHLDIAGTADNKGIVWEHQVPGATGTAVSTLFHMACHMEQL